MNKPVTYLLLLIAIPIFIWGCETGGVLRSSKKIDTKLQGTWNKISITGAEEDISWEFENGALIKTRTVTTTDSSWAITEEGDYQVDAGFSKAFIDISNFDSVENESLNGRWEIYKLKKEVLIIFTKDNGGVVSREFTLNTN